MGATSFAITVLLLGSTAFLLFVASQEWAKLATEREGSEARPRVPVYRFRSASAATGLALKALCLTLAWIAFVLIAHP